MWAQIPSASGFVSLTRSGHSVRPCRPAARHDRLPWSRIVTIVGRCSGRSDGRFGRDARHRCRRHSGAVYSSPGCARNRLICSPALRVASPDTAGESRGYGALVPPRSATGVIRAGCSRSCGRSWSGRTSLSASRANRKFAMRPTSSGAPAMNPAGPENLHGRRPCRSPPPAAGSARPRKRGEVRPLNLARVGVPLVAQLGVAATIGPGWCRVDPS